MARDFSARTDIDNTDPTNFPDGRILDSNPSSANNGTAVVEAVLGDLHQFFLKLLRDASITPNGNADTDSVSQYLNGLVAKIRETAASTTERGSIEIATQTEAETGTDALRAVVPLTLAGINRFIKNDDRTTFQKFQKTIEIGDWNMDTTNSVDITHGITNAVTRVDSVDVMIIQDGSVFNSKFTNDPSGTVTITGTVVRIIRSDAGPFDNASYDETPFNRGFINITWRVPV